LRHYLSEHLPEYMLPAFIISVQEIPVTPNGKVDRRALPVPSEETVESRAEHVAPRTPTERLMAQIWAEVLGVPRVGIHDNFFDLGGHSLLVMKAASRFSDIVHLDALHLSIPLLLFFRHPTLEGLARAIDGLADDESDGLSDEAFSESPL
jgi:hypothetical protein